MAAITGVTMHGTASTGSSKDDEKQTAAAASSSKSKTPPEAPRLPAAVKTCGKWGTDPYYGMKDPKDPAVIEFLEANNRYTQGFIDEVQDLTGQIDKELWGFEKEDDCSVPLRIGAFYYYRREVKGLGLPIYCRATRKDKSDEQQIFDCNQVKEEGKFDYFKVKASRPSPDGRFLTLAVDLNGTQHCDLWIKDLSTGEILDKEGIKNGSTGFAWCNNSKGFWYCTFNEQKRTDTLRFHAMGEDPAKDPTLFVEEDELFDIYVYKSLDDRFAVLGAHSKDTSEVRYAPIDDPSAELRLIQKRIPGLEYSVCFHGDGLFIHWRKPGQNFAIATATISQSEQLHWGPHLAADPEVDIDDILVLKEYLVVCHRVQGLIKITVHNFETGDSTEIPVDDEVYDLGLTGNIHFDAPVIRYYYNSPLCPLKICEFDPAAETVKVLKQEPLGGMDPKEFHTERQWIVARDGVKVPVTLLHKKGIALDHSNPLYAYAYGSYGAVVDDGFRGSWMCMAQRGVVCALIHPRGGGYLGPLWYEEGKMMKKKNTFYDFIDCVEALVKKGYSQPSKVAIQGGSAGGLLMGVVINERPDLFGYVHAGVPFVDVMTTMQDTSLPLTTQEYKEWGNPKDKEAGEYMASYSPYDNVRAREYPTVLITAGLNDEQVGYWEPAKWCARLRDFNTGDKKILLKTNMKAGHHSSSSRYEQIQERAEYVALILSHIGKGETA